ncbi:hypothetical protein HGH92_26600 [Chitinophaga varians]|uniref:Uncharacterized protein n=1 Tax=Chitinophaga varians TaxID=2202339 RepID=A0A847RXS3_9BACT|nr:hypothetical protein [Chitinophaga varians]NLR67903.1 hypothetical protein [Chitinophaga varians]
MTNLPVVNVFGDEIIVDIKDNCVYSAIDVDNRFSFSQMQYMPGACTYRFMYDTSRHAFAGIEMAWPIPDSTGMVEIPPKMVLDPYTACRLPKGMLRDEELQYEIVNADFFYARVIPKIYLLDKEEYFLDAVNSVLIGDKVYRPIEIQNQPAQMAKQLGHIVPVGSECGKMVFLNFDEIFRIDKHGAGILAAGYERYYEAISLKEALVQGKTRHRNGEENDRQGKSFRRRL